MSKTNYLNELQLIFPNGNAIICYLKKQSKHEGFIQM